MIITRYVVRETFKSQLILILILFLIFFCQKLVRILSAAVDGDIPIDLILSLLGMGVPEMAQLILPLSLFLALLMTLSRMYTESEITVMYACGLGKNILIRAALMLSLITIVFAAVNVIWISPWSSRHQGLILSQAKANPSMTALVEGQFKLVENGNSVLFVGNVKGKEFQNVFLARIKPKDNARPSVMIADRGHITQRPNGLRLVILDKGSRYEGTAPLLDFCITEFTQYQAVISNRPVFVDSRDVEQMTMHHLWCLQDPEARAEFHWRLTLIVSVMIMAVLVVPLSVINPRQGQAISMLPIMLLYLSFFLLQTSLRSNGEKGKLDPMLWMWITNVMYLALALILNVWNRIPARRLCASNCTR